MTKRTNGTTVTMPNTNQMTKPIRYAAVNKNMAFLLSHLFAIPNTRGIQAVEMTVFITQNRDC